jgi:TfoX/Sxy family transcriptional regulator of competence genes
MSEGRATGPVGRARHDRRIGPGISDRWVPGPPSRTTSPTEPYDPGVAYDEGLAERIRELIGDQAQLREQKMFGGLAFLVGGNMGIAASGEGGLLVRTDPAEGEQLVASGAAEPMEMGGRKMTGWVRVSADAVRTTPDLARWVDLGIARAASLPPKPAERRPR